MLQKTFTDNYLDQTIVKKIGQIPQYYVENNHPAIINRDIWELVRVETKKREKMRAKYSSADISSAKLVCKDCGGFFMEKRNGIQTVSMQDLCINVIINSKRVKINV